MSMLSFEQTDSATPSRAVKEKPLTVTESDPVELFERYREQLGAALLQAEEQLISSEGRAQVELDGLRIELRVPSERRGKHGAVYLIDVTDPAGIRFSCVAKASLEDEELYRVCVAAEPIIAEYLPRVYGVHGDYFFMEKIEGLELTDLQDKLGRDEGFAVRYAQYAYSMLEAFAGKRIRLNDVSFSQGHNCKVDSTSGRCKFIEVGTLQPDQIHDAPSLHTSAEAIVQQLFVEAPASDAPPGASAATPEYRIRFFYHLLRAALPRLPPEKWIVKKKILLPSHPQYQVSIDEAVSYDLKDSVFRRGMVVDGQQGIAPFGYFSPTKTVTAEFAQAIVNGDYAMYARLIRTGQ